MAENDKEVNNDQLKKKDEFDIRLTSILTY